MVDLNRLPRAQREAIYRRRRAAAVGVAAVLLLMFVWAVSSGSGDGSATAKKETLELPRGGRDILPRHRVVAFYGAPQDPELGVLGTEDVGAASRGLIKQANAYGQPGKPVLPAFELIVTLAQADAGADGLYRLRQTDAVVRRYLNAARAIKALLILDIQPGHAEFIDEVRALEPYLIQPDVSLALDPEWKTPEGVAPGAQIGSTDAATVNEVSAYLAGLVRAHDLPEKLLIVHQFTEGMVAARDEIAPRRGLDIVSNVDGFGTQELKVATYKQLANPIGAPRPGQVLTGAQRFNGFKLFYQEDTGLMTPRQVIALRPRVDVVVYE
jgi:hypothetical protein